MKITTPLQAIKQHALSHTQHTPHTSIMQARSYADLYASAEERDRARRKQDAEARMLRGALESTATATSASESSGFQRMAMCRKALEALDRRGQLCSTLTMHAPVGRDLNVICRMGQELPPEILSRQLHSSMRTRVLEGKCFHKSVRCIS